MHDDDDTRAVDRDRVESSRIRAESIERPTRTTSRSFASRRKTRAFRSEITDDVKGFFLSRVRRGRTRANERTGERNRTIAISKQSMHPFAKRMIDFISRANAERARTTRGLGRIAIERWQRNRNHDRNLNHARAPTTASWNSFMDERPPARLPRCCTALTRACEGVFSRERTTTHARYGR